MFRNMNVLNTIEDCGTLDLSSPHAPAPLILSLHKGKQGSQKETSSSHNAQKTDKCHTSFGGRQIMIIIFRQPLFLPSWTGPTILPWKSSLECPVTMEHQPSASASKALHVRSRLAIVAWIVAWKNQQLGRLAELVGRAVLGGNASFLGLTCGYADQVPVRQVLATVHAMEGSLAHLMLDTVATISHNAILFGASIGCNTRGTCSLV